MNDFAKNMKIARNFMLVGALWMAVASGCAAPIKYTAAPMQRLNDRTRWCAEETSDGFLLTVEYVQYQAIPVPSEVARAGRSELFYLADRFAKQHERKMMPIPDAAIRESSGRNGFTGVSSWSGQARVEYVP